MLTIDDVFEKYEDVPMSKKEDLKEQYANDLRKAGMSEDEIEGQIFAWMTYDKNSELMNMYGTENGDEIDDWIETNSPFLD